MEEMAGRAPVAILGDGASGRAAASLLKKMGMDFEIYSQGEGKKNFDASVAKTHRLCVYSPGFRPDHEWLSLARESGVQTICEPDFASLCWNGKIYCVTGTNGKTTLTSFLAHALSLAGFDAFGAGNIGKPLSEFCAEFYGEDTSKKIAVCEFSSFQSADLKYTRADALIWTNFAPDHLDWHADMREYFLAKLKIAELLRGKIFIAGKSVFQFAKENSITLPAFAKLSEAQDAASCPSPFNTPVQCENFSAAVALWKELGLDEKILFDAAASFSLASFRFGETYSVNGVEFMNDSKATNAHAAIAALNALEGRNVIWIGGGKNKFCDLDGLAQTIKDSASAAYLIGQSAEILKPMLENSLKHGVKICKTLEEAVEESARLAAKTGEENTVVLFSPAFSSFGMFENYEHRGKVFKNAVFSLKNLK